MEELILDTLVPKWYMQRSVLFLICSNFIIWIKYWSIFLKCELILKKCHVKRRKWTLNYTIILLKYALCLMLSSCFILIKKKKILKYFTLYSVIKEQWFNYSAVPGHSLWALIRTKHLFSKEFSMLLIRILVQFYIVPLFPFELFITFLTLVFSY